VRLDEEHFGPDLTVRELIVNLGARMTYGDYLSTSEMTRWIMDTDIDWDAIDPALADHPTRLARSRSRFGIDRVLSSPSFTPRALDLLWDNTTATALFSVQLYESYRHFHVFAQYLEAVGIVRSSDEEIVAIRRRNAGFPLRLSRAPAHSLHDERALCRASLLQGLATLRRACIATHPAARRER
jgi:hypothetical protein